MTGHVRADTVGSLLRPDYLLRARSQSEAGEMAPSDYKAIEDRAVDHISVPFHDESGAEQSVFQVPMSVTEKLRRKRMMTVEEYCYARAVARRPVKVTLPSPLMLFLGWSPERSRDAYADPFELFADGLALMREEAEELARIGCTYIQVDALDFGQLVDESQQRAWEQAGISVQRVMTEGVEMLTFLLEYEDARSGSFEPLRGLRDDKVVVLGLVSSRFAGLESVDQLLARIEEASRFHPRDQLALSTQCGCSSAGPGNAITEDAQQRKLQLIAEVAHRAWG
jgi:5-methyltetrahydropteroyltriglutamate--homocysteine methyltransferase